MFSPLVHRGRRLRDAGHGHRLVIQTGEVYAVADLVSAMRCRERVGGRAFIYVHSLLGRADFQAAAGPVRGDGDGGCFIGALNRAPASEIKDPPLQHHRLVGAERGLAGVGDGHRRGRRIAALGELGYVVAARVAQRESPRRRAQRQRITGITAAADVVHGADLERVFSARIQALQRVARLVGPAWCAVRDRRP